jgi:hypothetical protein
MWYHSTCISGVEEREGGGLDGKRYETYLIHWYFLVYIDIDFVWENNILFCIIFSPLLFYQSKFKLKSCGVPLCYLNTGNGQQWIFIIKKDRYSPPSVSAVEGGKTVIVGEHSPEQTSLSILISCQHQQFVAAVNQKLFHFVFLFLYSLVY